MEKERKKNILSRKTQIIQIDALNTLTLQPNATIDAIKQNLFIVFGFHKKTKRKNGKSGY